MVLLGGLEILAAGYFINEHRKNQKERQRQEQEDEEEERRRRRARSEHRQHRKDSRSSSAPPVAYHPPHREHKPYPPSPQPFKQQAAPQLSQPSAHGTALSQAQYGHRLHSATPFPTYTTPPAAINPPPFYSPQPYNTQPYNHPGPSQSTFDIPPHAYELGGDTLHPYSTGMPARRSSYDQPGTSMDAGGGPSPHVRFALPVNGDGSRLEEVRPGTPPPPYVP